MQNNRKIYLRVNLNSEQLLYEKDSKYQLFSVRAT